MFTLSLYILFSDVGYEFSKVTLNVKEKFSVWKIWEELSLLIGCLILKLKVWTGYQDPLLHLHKGSQTNKQMKRTIANTFRVLRKWCFVTLRIGGSVPCSSPAARLELPGIWTFRYGLGSLLTLLFFIIIQMQLFHLRQVIGTQCFLELH